MQSSLSNKVREAFDGFPSILGQDDVIHHFTIPPALTTILSRTRGNAGRLDTAFRWCWLEFLGWQPDNFGDAPTSATKYLAQQLGCKPNEFKPLEGSNIRNKNALIRQKAGWRSITTKDETELRQHLLALAVGQPNKSYLLGKAAEWCHSAKVIRPGLTVLERLIASIATDADDTFNQSVITAVNKTPRRKLITAIEALITNPPTRKERIDLQQLRAAPGEPSERNLNRLLDNIKFMHELGIGKIDLSHLPVARRQEFVKDAMRMSPADLRDLNKPRRVAMVICLLVDLWVSHQNYAPQMHQRLLKESRARAEGKRRKSVIGRLGDIFGYLRMLAEIFRIVRDPSLSAHAKISKINGLTAGPDNIDAIIKDCDDIAKPKPTATSLICRTNTVTCDASRCAFWKSWNWLRPMPQAALKKSFKRLFICAP